MTQEHTPTPCPCGGAGYKPQLRMIRINGTHKAIAYQYFCLGGCNREGVGINEQQAIEAWEKSINPNHKSSACNAHDALVERLRGLKKRLETIRETNPEISLDDDIAATKRVLKQAGAE